MQGLMECIISMFSYLVLIHLVYCIDCIGDVLETYACMYVCIYVCMYVVGVTTETTKTTNDATITVIYYYHLHCVCYVLIDDVLCFSLPCFITSHYQLRVIITILSISP